MVRISRFLYFIHRLISKQEHSISGTGSVPRLMWNIVELPTEFRSLLFWVVLQHMLVAVYQHIGTAHPSHFQASTGQDLCCITTQKSEDLIYTETDARNLPIELYLMEMFTLSL
jgi:hypothetical protein